MVVKLKKIETSLFDQKNTSLFMFKGERHMGLSSLARHTKEQSLDDISIWTWNTKYLYGLEMTEDE